jgi:hypothetical protein
MKDILNNELEDIKEGVGIYLRDAYMRGYEHGEQSQFLINSKLSDPNIILKDFMVFIKKYKMTSVDGEIRFSDENYVFFDENLIARFLLLYDYDND